MSAGLGGAGAGRGCRTYGVRVVEEGVGPDLVEIFGESFLGPVSLGFDAFEEGAEVHRLLDNCEVARGRERQHLIHCILPIVPSTGVRGLLS